MKKNEKSMNCLVHEEETINNMEGEWEPIQITIDSGAAESVSPSEAYQQYPTEESEGSRRGVRYVTANGDRIPNEGQKRLALMTEGGQQRGMTFQVCEVNRPLGSVSRICGQGHTVVFDDDGSYIMNKASGQTTWLRQEGGVYMLDAWVMPRRCSQAGSPSETPFQGRGNHK